MRKLFECIKESIVCSCFYSSWQGLRSPVPLIHRTMNWCFFYSLFMYHILWAATFLSNTKAFIRLHLNSVWQTIDSKIESFSRLFSFTFPGWLGCFGWCCCCSNSIIFNSFSIVSKPFPISLRERMKNQIFSIDGWWWLNQSMRIRQNLNLVWNEAKFK